MNTTSTELRELLERVPRRHSADNIKEINEILSGYESLLIQIESINPYYEKNTAVFFGDVEKVRMNIKKSNDNKASKKNKDDYFGEAAGDLKESIERLIQVFNDGSKTE